MIITGQKVAKVWFTFSTLFFSVALLFNVAKKEEKIGLNILWLGVSLIFLAGVHNKKT